MSTPPVPRGWWTCPPRRPSPRSAVATGVVRTTAEVVTLLHSDGLPKGDALATARIAGIMGAKRTPDLVPLCHPIAISGVTLDLTARRRPRRIRADRAHDRPHRRGDGGADGRDHRRA